MPVLNHCPKSVKDDMNLSLVAEITMEEIKCAVFQLGGSRAPGPDGLNGLFYQHHREVIKYDILKTIKNFFDSGMSDPTMNRTHISLVPKIPKIPNPEKVEHFRPISLCNFAYKIIFKVMAYNRLKPWVQECQNVAAMLNQYCMASGRAINLNK